MKTADISLVLLASGLSSRFENGDKLLTKLNGKTILERSIECVEDLSFASKNAVIGQSQVDRKTLLDSLGWNIIENDNPSSGQGYALSIAARALETSQTRGILIVLADMPFTPQKHVEKLIDSLSIGGDAVFTQLNDILIPPAIISVKHIEKFKKLSGDKGAKSFINALEKVRTITLNPIFAFDIDTVEDFEKAKLL